MTMRETESHEVKNSGEVASDQEPVSPLQRRVDALHGHVDLFIRKGPTQEKVLIVSPSSTGEFPDLLTQFRKEASTRLEANRSQPVLTVDLPLLDEKEKSGEPEFVNTLTAFKANLIKAVAEAFKRKNPSKVKPDLLRGWGRKLSEVEISALNTFREDLNKASNWEALNQALLRVSRSCSVVITIETEKNNKHYRVKLRELYELIWKIMYPGPYSKSHMSYIISSRFEDRTLVRSDRQEAYKVPPLDLTDAMQLLVQEGLDLVLNEKDQQRVVSELNYWGSDNLTLTKELIQLWSPLLRSGQNLEQIIAVTNLEMKKIFAKQIRLKSKLFPDIKDGNLGNLVANLSTLPFFDAASLQRFAANWPMELNGDAISQVKGRSIDDFHIFILSNLKDNLIQKGPNPHDFQINPALRLLLDRYYLLDSGVENYAALHNHLATVSLEAKNILGEQYLYHLLAANTCQVQGSKTVIEGYIKYLLKLKRFNPQKVFEELDYLERMYISKFVDGKQLVNLHSARNDTDLMAKLFTLNFVAVKLYDYFYNHETMTLRRFNQVIKHIFSNPNLEADLYQTIAYDLSKLAESRDLNPRSAINIDEFITITLEIVADYLGDGKNNQEEI